MMNTDWLIFAKRSVLKHSFAWALSLCVVMGAGVGVSAWAQVPDFSSVQNKDAGKFLPAHQAFGVSSVAKAANQYTVTWRIAQGYYLYHDRMSISPNKGFKVESIKWLTPSDIKDDPNFGRVKVFHQKAVALVTLKPDAGKVGEGQLSIGYQGCSEAGLCYPPSKTSLTVNLSAAQEQKPSVGADLAQTLTSNANQSIASEAATHSSGSASAIDSTTLTSNATNVTTATNAVQGGTVANTSIPAGSVGASSVAGTGDQGVAQTAKVQDASTNASQLSRYLSQASLPALLGTLLLLGIGLAFTPCVFPMMPILSSLIAGDRSQKLSPWRGFVLSLAYVLGMALVYAVLGSLMGALGARANVALWLQNPVVIVATALLFVVLALSMFGVFTLQLPSGLQVRLNALSNQQKGGQWAGAFIMGALSALVVSPCVSAPLVGVLGFISTTGQAGVGALALFALAFGMGIPLIVLGTTGGAFLPKAGAWMNAVKGFFGVALLAVAVSLVERIAPAPLTMSLWAALAAGTAVLMGVFSTATTTLAKMSKTLGVLLLAYALALLVGAWAGSNSVLQPLKVFTQSQSQPSMAAVDASTGVPFQTVHTIEALDQALAQARARNQSVVLDVSAEWCAACKVMEATTFKDAQVIARLSRMNALRLDVTQANSEQTAWMQKHGIFGPPVVMFIQANGQEDTAHRITGEANAAQLLAQAPAQP